MNADSDLMDHDSNLDNLCSLNFSKDGMSYEGRGMDQVTTNTVGIILSVGAVLVGCLWAYRPRRAVADNRDRELKEA